MKRLCFSLLVIVTLTMSAQDVLPFGASLPRSELKMKDVSGDLVSLNDVKTSNGILVMFSCNTCPYVMRNQDRTKEICHYAQSRQLGVILLNSNEASREAGDSYADMQNYARGQDYKWKYVVDSHNELADALGANRTPECFLFDRNAKLVYHGAIDNSPADVSKVTRSHLKEAIDEMLGGKDVSVKETRSVGCTIQRKK
jgi:thioredoxin-related protein